MKVDIPGFFSEKIEKVAEIAEFGRIDLLVKTSSLGFPLLSQ